MRRILAMLVIILAAGAAFAQDSEAVEEQLEGAWRLSAAEEVDWLKTAGGRTMVVETRIRTPEADAPTLWVFNRDGSLNRVRTGEPLQAELWQVADPPALRVVDVLGRGVDYAVLFAGPDTLILTRTARDASNEYATFTETLVLERVVEAYDPSAVDQQ